jgi:hypothetical protein
MASLVYHNALAEMMKGNINLHTGGNDIRCALVMTNTTADIAADAAVITDITLDEMDGANYARVALTSEAVSDDDSNNRAEFDAADVTFSSLGNGTRQVQGALIYKHVTNDGDSIPICFVEFGSTVNPGGGTLTVAWNAEGILQLA